jgi:glycine/D-amino acid oxidase-like deaminating enzyme
MRYSASNPPNAALHLAALSEDCAKSKKVTCELTGDRRIAVLGAGMLGSSVAILLARNGCRVTLFEASDRPLNRAGRWNEGKIHLGYLYAADRSLRTARKLLPGGLAFQSIVEDLIETSIEPHLTPGDECFLIHTDSVVDPESMFQHAKAVWALAADMGVAQTQPRVLTRNELEEISESPKIIAGYRIPERSVDTNWVADQVADRVGSDPAIELRCNCFVTSLSEERSRWRVSTSEGVFDGFDAVINALWEGKLAIDEAAGLTSNEILTYRYRVSVFLKVPNASLGNAVITTGPFGDIKNYDGKNVYLSWYPAGLLCQCRQKHAPATPVVGPDLEREIYNRIIQELGGYFPAVIELSKTAEQPLVRGGWIVAPGEGLLSDPLSSLHRRDELGIVQYNNYYSVATSKYSVAPWLATQIASYFEHV